MEKWGFIGLGQMGEPMALSLARSGIPLVVLDQQASARQAAKAAGIAVAADAKELAEACNIIGICVRDEEQLDALLGGDAGLYATCRRGTLLVIHSTIAPEACQRIATEAAEHGLAVIDAPVSGLIVRAKTGDLALYVGGTAGDLERARPGLEAMGSTILHMGTIGMGQVTKILNSSVSGPSVALVAETIELGLACGIDQAVLLQALAAGAADSFTVRNFEWFQTKWISEERGGVEGLARSIGHDANLALKLAREHELDLPLLGVAISTLPQVVVRTSPTRNDRRQGAASNS